MVSSTPIHSTGPQSRPAETATGRTSPQRAEAPEQAQPRSRVMTADDGILILRERLQQRMSVFDAGPEKLAQRAMEPPTASQVANRILGFVEARLSREQANGAGADKLSGLLEQAREGISRGFSEAREQIRALGLMTDSLATDIDDGFGRIENGLTALGERFLGDGNASAQPVSAVAVTAEQASRQQLAFEVVTRDGDKVRVTMDEQRSGQALVAARAGEEGTTTLSASRQEFSGRYSFSVEGSLDKGELDALAKLFDGARAVSERFFSGDVMGAFEDVQKLGLGGDELASYSLNLSYARASRVTSYVDMAPQSASRLAPLGGLAGDLRDLAEQAGRTNLTELSFATLMERMLSESRGRLGEDVSEPVQGLMDDFWRALLDKLNVAENG